MDAVAARPNEGGPVGQVAGDSHRVDPDHHRRANLHRQLEPHLVPEPQVLQLGGLALRKADPGDDPVPFQATDGVWLIEDESPTQLGDGDIGPRGDEAPQARRARALVGGHARAAMVRPSLALIPSGRCATIIPGARGPIPVRAPRLDG